MRTSIILALLALAIGTSACGDSAEGPQAEGLSPTGTSPTQGGNARTTAGGRPSTAKLGCTAAGITGPPFNEGACTERGKRFVVADGRSVLRLKSMNAEITGVSVSETLPGKAQRALPQGTFILIDLSVENRTKATQQFAPGQTRLVIAGQEYDERIDAEGAVNPRSLASPRHGLLRPGAKGEGAVIFDVPIADVRRVVEEGVLYVANFGGLSGGKHPELGLFRIYQE